MAHSTSTETKQQHEQKKTSGKKQKLMKSRISRRRRRVKEEKKKDLIINQQEIMGWNQAERDGNLQKSTSWNTERDQQTPIAPLPHCPIAPL